MNLKDCKYFSHGFSFAFAYCQHAYLIGETPVLLQPRVHRGALVYRIPATGKHISYKQLKKTLLNKE
jgi:hypothetical protein